LDVTILFRHFQSDFLGIHCYQINKKYLSNKWCITDETQREIKLFLTGITLETKFLGKKLSFFSNKREKFNPRLFLPVKNMEYG